MRSLVAIKPAIRCPGEESMPPHSAPNLISIKWSRRSDSN